MSSHIREFPAVSDVTIAGIVVHLSAMIATLGVTLDSSPTFRHISNVCRSAYFHLPALGYIRGMLIEDMAKTLATSLIDSRINYTNSLIRGSINIKWLQCVQNSVARVVLRDYSHRPAGDLLSQLHWLLVQSRISFKVACRTYIVLSTSKPIYVRVLLHHKHTSPYFTLSQLSPPWATSFPLNLIL